MSENYISLPMITPGREYTISHIADGKNDAVSFRGYGIFPGSKIKLLFNSPTKNPSAYEVMGAVLALRREDSKNIYVSPTPLRQVKQT